MNKIEKIKNILNEWGWVNVCEVSLDHSPCIKSIGNGKLNVSELVEYFKLDGVGTIIYNGEFEISERFYPYEELSNEIITEILDILEKYETDMQKEIN